MVKHEIVGENLILLIEGIDKLWAFKSELTIPLKHISDIRIDREVMRGWFRGFKFPGSNIPGVLTAGTFYRKGKRVFWDIHHPEEAVVISLKDDYYNELIIEVENPFALLEMVKAKTRF